MIDKIKWAKIDSFKGNFTIPSLTAYRNCPVCGSYNSTSVWQFNDFQFYSDSTCIPKRVNISACRCVECFTLYQNPYYSDFGFRMLFSEASCSYGASEENIDDQVKWISDNKLLKNGSTVLDIGCYEGNFLHRLEGDFKKIGVDIDQQAIERGRKKYSADNLELYHSNFEYFNISTTPDLILMFHVLEHLKHPVETLRNLRKIAHKETRLVIEVPILEKGFTNDINGFFSVQHLTHFSKNSLVNCLNKAGWEVTQLTDEMKYNGFRIVARPAQDKEKLIIKPGDVSLLYQYLSYWYQALEDVNRCLGEAIKSEKIIIWGAGIHTEILYHVTPFFKINPNTEYIIVDSDITKHGKSWRGINVVSPDIIKSLDFEKDKIKLLVSSYGSQEAIIAAALNLGVKLQNIVTIYLSTNSY